MSDSLVEVVRGPLVEAVHEGDIAVVDAAGSLIATAGDPGRRITFWRSAAKPLQSMPLVHTGAADHWDLSDADIAICCGSHNAEPHHVERIAALLERVGVTAGQLICGAHPPLHTESARALVRTGTEPTALHSNCSGLHAGMLAVARHVGVPTRGYGSHDHRVQQEVLADVCRFTGLERGEVILATDGCNVPTFGISVRHMALAYARLMSPSGVGEPYASAAGSIRAAMVGHPELVAGAGRFDTELMRAAGGGLVAKGGASGVLCVGVEGGIGIAVKISDGATGPLSSGRPTEVVMLETLRQLDLLGAGPAEELAHRARPRLRTVTGRCAGVSRPVFTLVRRPSP